MKKTIYVIILLIFTILLSMLTYNEILYFTGWKDSASAPYNGAPVKFYVINLDRQPERWEAFKKQADNFHIDVDRISATDGYKVKFIDQEAHESFTGADIKSQTKFFEPGHKYDVYCNSNDTSPEFTYNAFEAIDRPLTAGEIGIDCSTRLLWKKISNSPDPEIAVIFEDDAILLDDFDNNIKKFVSLLPREWDIAYLDADLFYFKKHLPYSIRFLLPIPDVLTNNYFVKIHNEHNVERIHAYAISSQSAKRLIEIHNNDTSVPIDYTIGRAINKRLITTYIALHRLASYNDKLASDISEMGRKEFEQK